jgi:hypothetical protein
LLITGVGAMAGLGIGVTLVLLQQYVGFFSARRRIGRVLSHAL